VPLYTTKVDIYLDACLPKLVDLATNGHDKETRLAACEFLHSLLIYMIGKNATKPQAGAKRAEESQEIAPFAKIYAKLFPVVIKLASETEQIVRILFQPLIL
jgi:DNA-dependent protein kinase catalytic subunit